MTIDLREEFVRDLVQVQPRLRTFIRALVRDASQVDDVLQETNLVLWRKASDFVSGTNFGAWACRAAYFQVLAFRKRAGQSRLIFDEELLHNLADAAQRQSDNLEPQRVALRICLARLTDEQRELLNYRYNHAESIGELAVRLDRPEGSIRQALYRVRSALMDCIRRRLQAGERE